MASKYTLHDLVDIVDSDGLGYSIQYGINADNIDNAEVAQLWTMAANAMDRIETILEKHRVEEGASDGSR